MADINNYQVSREWLVYNRPVTYTFHVSREFLTATAPASDAIVFSRQLSKEWLYLDRVRAFSYQVSKEVLTATAPASNPAYLRGVYFEYLYRVLDLVVYQESKDTLIVLDEAPTVHGQYKQTRMAVTQPRYILPPNLTISYETVNQAMSLVVQARDAEPFPTSPAYVNELVSMAVQASPLSVISYETAPQTMLLASQRSVAVRPGDVLSEMEVNQNVVMVVQSIDIPYQPTSGEFARHSSMLVAIASDYPSTYSSPAFVGQQAMKVVQSRPMGALPRSTTTVAEMVSQAVTGRDPEGLPISTTVVAEMVSQAAVATEMPEPHGPDITAQEVMLVALGTEMPEPYGLQRTAQMRSLVAIGTDLSGIPLSDTDVTQMVTLVLQGSDYALPPAMLAAERAQSVMQLTAIQADYPPAEIQSYTYFAQGRVLLPALARDGAYPDPDDMYAASKYNYTAQFVEAVAQRNLIPLPISYNRLTQFQILTAQRNPMPDPDEMANTGSFARQVLQHLAYVADYPSPVEPASDLYTLQVSQQVAVVAEYPPAVLPVDAIIDQLSQQVMVSGDFPDPSTLTSMNEVFAVTEQVAVESAFPDAGDLHSPVVLFSLSTQLTTTSSYPDKDAILSYAVVAALSQQTAFTATYPDKDSPQSILRVNQVRHHVMRRDLTMYQMPTPPRRHRVRIVCRNVY